MRYRVVFSKLCTGIVFVFFCLLFLSSIINAQNVKRIVIVKTDGVPGYLVDRFVKERDPATGKSILPWFEEVFYKNGTRLENFYVRGMSLSGPSWSLLDTGQHLQIKGNVEYDRYTLRAYDYLNFLPLHINYGLKKQVDMPAVEILDQLKLPLLSDAFPFENRYTSYQLIQRGNQWGVLAKAYDKIVPKNPNDFLDEWTMGLDFRSVTIDQTERDIIRKLNTQPQIDYFDYFNGVFDHVSHHNNDMASRLNALKQLDRIIGRMWMGIQSSLRADETALAVVSDHGFNSNEKVYSQGFNIVKLLASAGGGGHHVVTKRRLMLDYSIKGVYPLIPLITTASKESFYLKKQSADYPTVLVDFDGNERTSFHLRNSDLNVLHILFQQLKNKRLSNELNRAATDALFNIIIRNQDNWRKNIAELNEELNALQRLIQAQQKLVTALPKKFTPEETVKGADDEAVRLVAQLNAAIKDERDYRGYVRMLSNLLALNPETFDPKKIKMEDYIARGAMGDRNSVYQLQNYVVGLSEEGLTLNASGNQIDFEKSFRRIDYFNLLHSQRVRNNVQAGIGNRPVDFIAKRIPLESIAPNLSTVELKPDDAPIWIYGGSDKQALILTRKSDNDNLILRYLPIADLRQSSDGRFDFQIKSWDAGFPLKIFEDENFKVPVSERAAWLNDWHTDVEWLRATHETIYSNAIVSLNEQLDEHAFASFTNFDALPEDEKLLYRFRRRQRALTEADVLVLANNHWNFDVRGFNPGGNHGSFFRVSTNSTFMIAGGAKTNIPRGLNIEEPYDSLSFTPTILKLMGKVNEKGEPNQNLYERGFRKFPGRIVQEIFQAGR